MRGPVNRGDAGAPPWQAFAGAVALAGVLPQVPYLRALAWPFMQFQVLVHELGHGFAALLAGGRFDSLVVYWGGGGVAQAGAPGRLAGAFVSAGGLVGPACAGALAFALARTPRTARAALVASGALLLLCDLLFIRSLAGWLVATAAGAAMLAIGRKASGVVAQYTLAFVGAELALSAYASRGYLFTEVARLPSGDMPSDVANMASNLFLPYWFWGACCGAFSLAVLLLGGWFFLRPARAAR